MNRTSIVLLSYNTRELTPNCIESIRRYTPRGSYEIIVIDNASHDGSVEWLREQKDIKLLENQVNKGFPAGCNQGIALAEQRNDIMLLNSDTIVTPRWLENLQAALYSSETVGAVGPMAQESTNWQEVYAEYKNLDELISFADKYNHSNPAAWMEMAKLLGFCFLIKNAVFQQIGLLDERFSPGNYEDDDYSLRITLAGYKLLICRDTFIHHYGHASFIYGSTQQELVEKHEQYTELIRSNFAKFSEKWHVTKHYIYFHDVCNEIHEEKEAVFRVVVIGCNAGVDLFYLRWNYPKADICGVTENSREAAIAGKNFDVCHCCDLEDNIEEALWGKYDYILLAEEDKEYQDFDGYIGRLVKYLTPEGSIHICAAQEWRLNSDG